MTKTKADPLIGHTRVTKDGTRYSYMGGNWWQQIDHVCFFMETRVAGGDLILISHDRENYLGMYMPLNTAWMKSNPTDRSLYEPTLYYKVFKRKERLTLGSQLITKNTTHFRHELEQWFKNGMPNPIERPKDFDRRHQQKISVRGIRDDIPIIDTFPKTWTPTPNSPAYADATQRWERPAAPMFPILRWLRKLFSVG